MKLRVINTKHTKHIHKTPLLLNFVDFSDARYANTLNYQGASSLAKRSSAVFGRERLDRFGANLSTSFCNHSLSSDLNSRDMAENAEFLTLFNALFMH